MARTSSASDRTLPTRRRAPRWHLPSTTNFTGAALRLRCSNAWLVYGRDQNFEYFSASVLPENYEMLDVFRDSGFDVHSTTESGHGRGALVAAAVDRERRRRGRARATGDHRLAAGHSEAALRGGRRRVAPRLQPRAARARVAARVRLQRTCLCREPFGDGAARPALLRLAARSSDRRRSRRHRGAARSGARGRRRLRGRRRKGDRRHLSGFRRDRRARPRAAGRARRAGARLRHAHGRPQLHGGSQHRPRRSG